MTKSTITLDPEHLHRTPGEILKLEMEKAALQPAALSRKTGLKPSFISMLMTDTRAIRAGTAIALAAALVPSAEQWLIYQNNFDLTQERTVSTMVENGTDEDQAKGWFLSHKTKLMGREVA